MIPRQSFENIEKKMNTGKALVIIGARQVGKTTLAKSLLKQTDYLLLNGDEPSIRTSLTEADTARLKNIIGKNQTVFIDEAQRIPDIGITLKIIVDNFTDIQVIVSGSSAFDLNNTINEPLTGRKWEFELFPISWNEYQTHIGFLNAEQNLENRLIYGFYPDVINNCGDEKNVLVNLAGSYLYKDILAYSDIKKPQVLDKLLRALAFQMGSEVKYTELAGIIGINKDTVQKYIDILEKSYVIFRLESFSRNRRNEIKHSRKVYFYDNGIRNTIIGDFKPLSLRQDKGALWENFIVSEKLKQNKYRNTFARMYFWRNTTKQEIDLIEEKEGKIYAYEIKWRSKKAKFPLSFTSFYDAECQEINRENFREFIT